MLTARAIKRFHASYIVDPASGCWLWSRAKSPQGYGRLKCGKTLRASRVSWTLRNGEIPTGMLVLHKCDVAACVNPDHLYLGDAAQNAADRVSRQRQARGERVGTSKISELVARAIFVDPRPSTDIAADYEISRSAVLKIKRRVTWALETADLVRPPHDPKNNRRKATTPYKRWRKRPWIVSAEIIFGPVT